MPENYTSLITMVVVLVVVCGVIGVWTLRSRRRNASVDASGPSKGQAPASRERPSA